MTPKQQFIDEYNEEHAKTVRVLRSYPQDQTELQPHPKLRTARELAFIFVGEQGMCQVALTTDFDWSKPPNFPSTPADFSQIISMFEQGREGVVGLVAQKDDMLTGTVSFPTGPGQIADWPLAKFLWMMLCDQIHHRGQFSVYLRIAGGKVPAIYGPSADEPWM
jgi:uncharacterized damage-inducible protein DinB